MAIAARAQPSVAEEAQVVPQDGEVVACSTSTGTLVPHIARP